jgi:TRL-like protein family
MRKLILAAFVLAVATACTGTNLHSGFYGGTNTNPVPEYANPYRLLLKGGWIFHRNGAPGPIGNASAKLQGRACSHSVLYLVAWGDASIESAKNAGGIKKVASVEFEQTGIFLGGIYHRFCTLVSGE